MKTLKFTLAVALLCLSGLAASAQSGYNLQSVLGGTNNVAATTTNSTITATITTTRSSIVTIAPEFVLTGAGTSVVVFNFSRSIDNSTWETNQYAVNVTAAGASQVSTHTNFTVGAIGFLRLESVQNPNASAITNLVIKYANKPGI